ncbi:hypothetical protein AAC387_Pa04g0738 [Persea americana]
MGAAVKLQLPVFLLSERRKTGKSGIPPTRAAVKLRFPVFLLSLWRKTGKCEFTAHAGGGKAACASEESRKTFPFPINVKEIERINSSIFSRSPHLLNRRMI